MRKLPPIEPCLALFLDFDGTLTEIAPRPDAVRIDPKLVPALQRLTEWLGGALAVVTGRSLPDIDRFLAPLQPVLAAEHGAHLRYADGRQQSAAAPDLGSVEQAARRLAATHPQLLVERKPASVALHYRAAQHLGELCRDTLLDAIAGDARLQLLGGKQVVEVKQAGVDKGRAIGALMASAPFAGRRPLFVGDDATDEAGFDCVQRAGGLAVKVGEGETIANHRCGSPAEVRAWLFDLARRLPAGSASR